MNGENKRGKNLATGLKALLLRFITEIVMKWGCTISSLARVCGNYRRLFNFNTCKQYAQYIGHYT
jgi:hypothetical protein